MKHTVREFVLSVNPDAPAWIIQLAELLHEGGSETNASLAASRAADFARIPSVGQGLQKIVEGLSDLREIKELRLTPMQLETLQNIFAEMKSDFSKTIDRVSDSNKRT